MVVSLLLTLALGVQSCAATVGGSIASGLGDTRGDDLTGAGALGLLAALLWLVGAALVMAKPRVSMWLFAASAPLCVIGAALGFTDLYLWAVAAVLFALGSWRGVAEAERELDARVAQRQAELAAGQTGWHADPWGERRLRYHDGREWTPHTSD